MGGAVHHPGLALRQLGQQLVAQALGGELDGGQGVLDLVGQAPGHLAPGGVALGGDEAGDVVEDDDVALLGVIGLDQGAATTEEHLTALGAEQADLLAPFGMPLQVAAHRLHPGEEVGMVADQGIQTLMAQVRLVQGQNLAGGGIDGAQAVVTVEDDDPGGQPPQHRLQVEALGLHRLLGAGRRVPGAGQAPGHGIEGGDQEAQLILLTGEGQAQFVIPLGHGAGAAGDGGHRGHQPAGEVEGGDQGGEQAEQQHQGQAEGEAPLQGLAQVAQFLVAVVGLFQVGGQAADVLRGGEDGLHHQVAAHRVRHQHPHHQFLVGAGLQFHLIAAGAGAAQQLPVRQIGHQLGRVLAGVAAHLAIAAEDGDLQGAGLLAQLPQPQGEGGGGTVLDPGQELFGVADEDALIEVQGGLVEGQGILHGAVDLDVEPGVDAAQQEAQRVVIDHGHRQQGHQAEEQHQAAGEPGAGDLVAVVPDQPQQIGHHRAHQGQEADQHQRQEGHEGPAQRLGVLHRPAHQVEGDEQDGQEQDDREQARLAPAGQGCNGHVVQPEDSFQEGNR